MAHFAKLDNNNVVLSVHVVNNACLDPDNEEQSGIEFLTEWSNGYSRWKQTSYNSTFRKRYAGIGYFYDENNDVFIAPQPYASWTLDQDFAWQPPSPYPNDGHLYVWDENILEWVNVEPNA
jgi:hypothetical protein